VVRRACWALVSHEQPEKELETGLALARPPSSPARHLSADLLLRFLPQVHRRARALDPSDRLTELLAVLLRQWPLSGVLSGIEDAPTTSPEFGGHPGLLLLYAERWVVNPRPLWLPSDKGFEYIEMVWRAAGKDPAALPRPGQPAAVSEQEKSGE
jgi:hypothetical protein